MEKPNLSRYIVPLLAATLLVQAEQLPYIFPSDISEGIKAYIPYARWPQGDPFDIGPNSQLLRGVPWKSSTGGNVTQWDWGMNSADVSLPPNLTINGNNKVAMSAYMIDWAHGSSTLEGEVERTSPDEQKFCVALLNPGSDFSPEIRKNNEIYNVMPSVACSKLLGRSCVAALEDAFSKGFEDDCSGATGVWAGDVPECADSWTFKPGDLSFVGNLASNGTTLRKETFFAYALSPHPSDNLHDWWREVNRTQLAVVKDGSKPARLLCTTMRDYAFGAGERNRPGLAMLGLSVGIVVSYLLL